MKIANGMQFVNDEAVIGKWNNIGWIENTFCRTVNRTGYLKAGQKAFF